MRCGRSADRRFGILGKVLALAALLTERTAAGERRGVTTASGGPPLVYGLVTVVGAIRRAKPKASGSADPGGAADSALSALFLGGLAGGVAGIPSGLLFRFEGRFTLGFVGGGDGG